MIRLTTATASDLALIDAAIAAEERALVAERYALPCAELLAVSMERSECSYVIWSDDKPLLIFGVQRASLVTREGYLWMIGTKHIAGAPLAFARATRRILHRLMRDYDRLTNEMDCKDAKAIKWARWCGAQLSGEGRYQRFEVRNG